MASFAFTLLLVAVFAAPAIAGGDPERGKAIFTLAAGCNCHTPTNGPIGAGGGEVPTPFGTFYGSNITPDRETGIGAWSDAEIAAAIRDGVLRDRGAESPAMPYYQYSGMTDGDVADLIAYLRSLPPVRRANQPHDGELPLARWAYAAWRLFFANRPAPPPRVPSSGVERGRYLVHNVSICVDCHTPRNFLGVPERSMYLGGAADGPGGEPAPNITPHVGTGIGEWSADDVVALLTLGMLPNFDSVQGHMAEVIDGRGGGPGYKNAPESDLRAIAAYLKSIPPIDNAVGGR
jgi:mono/diheme cytochrome c family protein